LTLLVRRGAGRAVDLQRSKAASSVTSTMRAATEARLQAGENAARLVAELQEPTIHAELLVTEILKRT
jgi:hypothetical protein